MADSVMLNSARSFAVTTVDICRMIRGRKREGVLANQLIRSGTSIGANIYESKYAQSTADFISKMQIALKECYETEYWLDLLYDTKCITENEYKPLRNQCGSIRRMLIASINTARSKLD
ncbi:MAG: four helix bundle protein [Clostridia bacterium]|nr:four helix bundle protein [Clostridia bacterium]